ncbi:stanniocalcin-2a [Latimeria chalumnae]|nr:PREDICTED: stanniocalcin-2 isoform X1 [Latimeria chalumnae]|eukprot:XP_005992572.1 PREDICTED: stanniocalcin-2 isoform X1 [Latimeria chalumnae]
MAAEKATGIVALLLVFANINLVFGTDATELSESVQERLAIQQKGRLSLQNTAEIQHCLVNSGDVGCGVFECFENNSCEIRGLQEICMTFLHNAGKFDAQGKSFIKDALKCKAHGLRHKFSCISRKCPAIKEMVFQLQRECYLKHNLCSAAKDNVNVIVEMIHFKDLFPHGPYVELVNTLLTCGEQVKEAITRSVRGQCEQNWGTLCDSLSFCSSAKQDEHIMTVTPPPNKKHFDANKGIRSGDEFSLQHEIERENSKTSKVDKEKGGKGNLNAHTRIKSGSQGSRRVSGEVKNADDDSELSDIQR